MTTLVVGATGATGRHLVRQLLDRGHDVRAVVRSADRLPADLRSHPRLSLIESAILDLSDSELEEHLRGCDSVASCLGHNLTPKGIWGRPRFLVADAIRRLCAAVKATPAQGPTRLVLMNTTGNRNPDLNERLALAERILIAVIRRLVPPQADNERAAEILRTEIGRTDARIEWAVVRPDSLVDADHVTEYEVHPSPTRGVIFNSGRTSRINVGHFMARLITEDDLWAQWKGQMPVIYNREVATSGLSARTVA